MNPLENAWHQIADQAIASAGSIASFLTALVLILIARLVARPVDRPKLRGPLILVACYLVLWVLRDVTVASPTFNMILGIAALFVVLLAIGNTSVLLAAFLATRKRGQPVPRILTDIVHVLVVVAAAMLALRSAGLSLGSLVATSAVLTAVIGLSLQDTLGNLFAGLAIQAQQPFEVGDWIQFDPDPQLVGQVIEINWRATKVQTNDHVEVTVPNGALAKIPIRNFTKPSLVSRRTLAFHAPYEIAPVRVQQVVAAAVADAAGVLRAPPVEVITAGFSDSGIEYHVRFFIDRFTDRAPIESGVRDRVWYALSRAGIAIPFPIRDLRMHTAANDPTPDLIAREGSLGCVDFLRVLSQGDLRSLAASSSWRRYAPGESIVRQGEPGDELFIVVRGAVTVRVERDGLSADVATLSAGEYFGEMSLLTGEPRSATVRASSDTELLAVGTQPFAEILRTTPALAEALSEEIARRRAQTGERAGELATQGMARQRQVTLGARIKAFFRV